MTILYARLKQSQIADTRNNLLTDQGGRCALCKLPCSDEQAVLDHDHQTGAIRGTLHRGCNALLGKVENNYKRYGVSNLRSFLSGLATYLERHLTNSTGLLHPTYKTEDEKRERRNKLARARRATKKGPL
jgi:hypothetical protein